MPLSLVFEARHQEQNQSPYILMNFIEGRHSLVLVTTRAHRFGIHQLRFRSEQKKLQIEEAGW